MEPTACAPSGESANQPVWRRHGLEALTLQATDGATAVVSLHGAHVVSWVPAGGSEMLYLSPRSAFAAGQAIRGGVPVIFPQFSTRGPGMRHGFARLLPWQVVPQVAHHDGQATAVLRLADSASTRPAWNHGFALELTVTVRSNQLALRLACCNAGSDAFGFSAALHTYLRTDDIGRTVLHGLAGHPFWDALDDSRKMQPAGALRFDGELDRVYGGVAGALTVQAPFGAGTRQVTICQSGFEDVVVWNPGAVKCAALADMPPDGWRGMLCVEAARIERPVLLDPGQSWVGEQTLVADPG